MTSSPILTRRELQALAVLLARAERGGRLTLPDWEALRAWWQAVTTDRATYHAWIAHTARIRN